eukprot:1891556-Pyramimonas_sp.AAC.1
MATVEQLAVWQKEAVQLERSNKDLRDDPQDEQSLLPKRVFQKGLVRQRSLMAAAMMSFGDVVEEVSERAKQEKEKNNSKKHHVLGKK